MSIHQAFVATAGEPPVQRALKLLMLTKEIIIIVPRMDMVSTIKTTISLGPLSRILL